MKYLLCFRGSDHQHDALKDGINPHGGDKTGPIKYEGGIDTEGAIPMTPVLDVAAQFPNSGDILTESKSTIIDVVLIPLPEENDSILNQRIKQHGLLKSTNEAESFNPFVNTASIQILDSISALRVAAQRYAGENAEDPEEEKEEEEESEDEKEEDPEED